MQRKEGILADSRPDGARSLRINDPWRICFRWNQGDALDVEIVDYHRRNESTMKNLPHIHPGEVLLRLAAALGTSERFWLGLQADCDLEQAHRTLGKAVAQIERIAA